ncbi:GroES-like protein [Pseudohyphozyma bogoriensis]|nr:GroES-like protein [Pseudohyphozyma bogoriensis]
MNDSLPGFGPAAVLTSVDAETPYQVRQVRVPTPKKGEVLIQLSYSGCCYTDTHERFSADPAHAARPRIGGHEGVGRVVALGEGVTEVKACQTGNEEYCPIQEANGFQCDGTFTRYAIARASHVIPVPDSLEYSSTAPLMCAGVTVFNALKGSGVSAGQWVCIPGAGGGLGHIAVQYAKAMGCRVIGIDAASKRELALECGADYFVDFQSTNDVVVEVLKATGGGPHVTLVTSVNGYKAAFQYARNPRGVIMCIGMGEVPFDTTLAVIAGLRILGTSTASRRVAALALEVAAANKIRPRVEVRTLEDVERTMQELKGGKVQGRIVIDLAKA